MVVAGDRDLFNSGRLLAGYQYLAGRLLCRSLGLAVAVLALAGRGDRAADGIDGLSRDASRTGQPAAAPGCGLGRDVVARDRRFDDLRRPRSGQSPRLAGIRHGHGAAVGWRPAVHRFSGQRNDRSPALGPYQCAVFAQCRALAGRHSSLYADQPVQFVAGAEFSRCRRPAAARTNRHAVAGLWRPADVRDGAGVDLSAQACRPSLCADRRSVRFRHG